MATTRLVFGRLDRVLKVPADAATAREADELAAACGLDLGPLVRTLIVNAAHQFYGDEDPADAGNGRDQARDRARFERLPASMQAAIEAAAADEADRRSAKAATAANARWTRYY